MSKKFRQEPVHKRLIGKDRAKFFQEKDRVRPTEVSEEKSHLAPFVNMEVTFSGEIRNVVMDRATVILHHVSICDDYMSHMWIPVDTATRKKLSMVACKKGVRVYFKGVVRQYVSNMSDKNIVKYGVYKVRLVDSYK